ncbi:dipeptide ABC transporter ATP-binding protein [Cryptosporangium arvum]|uniref:ATPase component of various ABC-type transport systems with duplicated ATPase domain n=1 Tax=Cryptosporangium arvum DSM 44712 TaxID=927661 RepID=A0A010Z487_9ACTN|nr:ABC transporter ATP-binding protein [Cryptosporangium arvum]EXG82198.1 ATPase component of various ABC-type transport systems with duplicated ATPase domain [Cryptosporangium arvum DSM 44712]
MTALLTVENLSIRFGATHAVDDLSFTLEPGAALGIVGESGSGKSATALALLGLHTDARVTGRIVYRDVDLVAADPSTLRALRGAEIAMVFQDPLSALSPFHSVGHQIAEVYRLHTGASAKQARARAVEVLDQVHIPDAARRARAHPHEFSGGMRQRALIAMALACRPRLIVADEPTTALDVTVQAQILDLLDEVRATTSAALVLISHDLGVVAGSADEVVVMRAGCEVEQGPVDEVLVRPTAPYTRELVAAVPSTADGGPRNANEQGGRALMRLEGVTKVYPLPRRGLRRVEGMRAVDDVTLDVHEGETLGLVGESGTGKSTLARIMAGLVSPTDGTRSFDGPPGAIQMVFQDSLSSLNPRRTIGDSITEPLRLIKAANARERVDYLLERVGLTAAAYDRYPHELSGGMRQRVGIARALAPHPRLILCDEPVSSLDVTTQAQVLALLNDIRREDGLTLVFVSHDLAVVRRVADRIAVMHAGRIVELGDAERVYTAPEHDYTRALLAAMPVTDPVEARRRRELRRRTLINID